ncbi:probable protein phosphatase 2C 25 [Olea europaea var. sylvestris]|uniref:probable protein phosphatase 2C 25 n=1 Tax=Olea europaea var. sylvestris TaxID=158386 RepID=UPI000C1D4B28|nr:probable protein phosphatase 2C 25 [Olea europaea var. sylvestris]
MPCAIAAVSSSPIFSPSPRKISPIFCKPASSPPPPCLSPSPLTLKHFRKPFNSKDENLIEEEEATSKLAALKRKRPARINIPVMDMGFDTMPDMDLDRLSEVEVEGEGYSLYCKRGKRGGAMEDRYSAVMGLQGDYKQAFFGVFDGHGGAGAAEYAAKNLDRNIMKEVERRTSEEEGIEKAVKKGYLTTDMEFLKEDLRGGTCCVTALIHRGNLVVSNAGDCRAVMSRVGEAQALTIDHRPCREDERERIESLGGYVDYCHGVWRVHGSLAVSRAIGDRHLKQWVTAEPVTKVVKIIPEYEFLILASDGLWDKVSNQEAVDVVRPLCVGIDKPEPFSACKKLVDLSLSRGSADDISVMVIQLAHFIQ